LKRVEVLLKSSALNTFEEVAKTLGISEYDVSEVRLSPNLAVKERRRLYRGQEYTLDLLPAAKVEFIASDDGAKVITQNILALITPERVMVSSLDEIVGADINTNKAAALPYTERTLHNLANVTH
jgi:nitrogen regulatory protein PII